MLAAAGLPPPEPRFMPCHFFCCRHELTVRSPTIWKVCRPCCLHVHVLCAGQNAPSTLSGPLFAQPLPTRTSILKPSFRARKQSWTVCSALLLGCTSALLMCVPLHLSSWVSAGAGWQPVFGGTAVERWGRLPVSWTAPPQAARNPHQDPLLIRRWTKRQRCTSVTCGPSLRSASFAGWHRRAASAS